jgi:hypothetical protein
VKCGDSYYTYGRHSVIEYMGADFTAASATADTLTAAERLSGIEWHRRVEAPYSAYRERQKDGDKWGPWSEWQDPPRDTAYSSISRVLMKKKGVWYVHGWWGEWLGPLKPLDEAMRESSPSCSDSGISRH